MTHIKGVAVTAQATFGRDGAMFEGLLGFVAQLSGVLWGLVILTLVIRFVGIRIYRRGAARRALVATVAPSAAVPAAAAVPSTTAIVDLVQPAAGRLTNAVTNATFDEVLQPAAEASAAVAASVKVAGRALRERRAEPRSAAHVPSLAANSIET